MREEQNAAHKLPIGAVVVYTSRQNRATLVIVQHSRDCDGSPLYMVAERPISPPDLKLYSIGYLTYRLHAGWFAGNVPLSMLRDMGGRVAVTAFTDTVEAQQMADMLSVTVGDIQEHRKTGKPL